MAESEESPELNLPEHDSVAKTEEHKAAPEEQVKEHVESLIEEVKESLTKLEKEVVDVDLLAPVKSFGTTVESFIKPAGESSEQPEETEKPTATEAAAGPYSSWMNCCGLLDLFSQNR